MRFLIVRTRSRAAVGDFSQRTGAGARGGLQRRYRRHRRRDRRGAVHVRKPEGLNGLIAKLDTAATKLSEDKNADALQKLVDFQTTLNALATAAKPKVDPAVAQALITEAQAVIDCINAVGTA